MLFLPISLNIEGKNILLIGGGKVALEKITSLKRFTDRIYIVTQEADDVIKNYAYPIRYKSYSPDDLEGFFIVYACTNNRETNEKIKQDCHARGILVNVVDKPSSCDSPFIDIASDVHYIII